MRKRIIHLFLSFLVSVSMLSGCAADESNRYVLLPKTVPMRIQVKSDDEITEDEITLYFVNGGDIPYVAVSQYMPVVGSYFRSDSIDIPAASYTITHPLKHHTMVSRTDNDSFMDIDTLTDTIEFVGFDYFTAEPGSSLFMSVITLGENGRGGVSNLFRDDGKSYERAGETLIKFNLSEYLIDLIEKDGECYVPLQTINDLLVSQNYVYVVFNGEEVIVSGYYSDLIDEMYHAPTGEMSEGFAQFNYNELRFMLDTFYGLKEEHDIEDFGDFFVSTGLVNDLSGTDSKAFDAALQKLVMKYFDDSHSFLIKPSYLTGPRDLDDADTNLSLFGDAGTSYNTKVWDGTRIKIIRSRYYPDHPELYPDGDDELPWLYEEVGDTAFITFDQFIDSRNDYYTEANLDDPQDTIELISYAQSQITRENSPVKNVVVDLSCNVGGSADAAVFLLAWFDKVGQAALRSTLTGAQSVCSYEADVNLDGEFDDEDWLPFAINKYILISGLSFSCGNLIPASFKGSSSITLLGRTSGGGSCVVRPCTTASGAIFTISSPRQVSIIRNGSLYNADQGIDPDFTISKPENFYDREKLVEFIHELP